MKLRLRDLLCSAAAAALLAIAPMTASASGLTYQVTITNITKANAFTPILAATHRNSVSFFEVGEKASDAIGTLAEGGAIGPLQAVLKSLPNQVSDTAATGGLLHAGESVTLELRTRGRARSFSMAAMILPTNDSFVALNTVDLPRNGSVTYYALGYDAGSEINDESCANIPGPIGCDGNGDGAFTAVDGEGFIFIANGIHGIGDLNPDAYDWRNPIAKVTITRGR